MIKFYETEFTVIWVEKYPIAFITALTDFREKYAGWNISLNLSQLGRISIKAERQLTADVAIDEALRLADQPHYGHMEDEVAHLHEAIALLREYKK